jgi:hypothetical protein
VDAQQLLGQVLSRDIASGAQVDGEIDAFIERRHQQRVKEEGERAQEAAWAESARKHAQAQRQQARLEWHLHHTEQAERRRTTLESLIAHHEAEAEKLGAPLGGDAA